MTSKTDTPCCTFHATGGGHPGERCAPLPASEHVSAEMDAMLEIGQREPKAALPAFGPIADVITRLRGNFSYDGANGLMVHRVCSDLEALLVATKDAPDLAELVAEWQSASGLGSPEGDPSEMEPDDLRRHLDAWQRASARAVKLLRKAGGDVCAEAAWKLEGLAVGHEDGEKMDAPLAPKLYTKAEVEALVEAATVIDPFAGLSETQLARMIFEGSDCTGLEGAPALAVARFVLGLANRPAPVHASFCAAARARCTCAAGEPKPGAFNADEPSMDVVAAECRAAAGIPDLSSPSPVAPLTPAGEVANLIANGAKCVECGQPFTDGNALAETPPQFAGYCEACWADVPPEF